MANKRMLECGKFVLAFGQEGSLKDLKTKLVPCFECVDFVSCKVFIHNTKLLTASLENLAVMAAKIKEEQNFINSRI